jgi:hypothetical protein
MALCVLVSVPVWEFAVIMVEGRGEKKERVETESVIFQIGLSLTVTVVAVSEVLIIGKCTMYNANDQWLCGGLLQC